MGSVKNDCHALSLSAGFFPGIYREGGREIVRERMKKKKMKMANVLSMTSLSPRSIFGLWGERSI